MSITAAVRRMFPGGAVVALLLLAGSGSASAQTTPSQADASLVEVRTWANSPAEQYAPSEDAGGVLLDTTDAQALLAVSALGAGAMALRAAARKGE